MPKVTFIEANGAEHTVDIPAKRSVMEGALRHSIPGIVAECGGSCSCATCHVYVDAGWLDKIPAPSQLETEMLGSVNDPQPTSRLSCQIRIKPELEGLIVRIPQNQTNTFSA